MISVNELHNAFQLPEDAKFWITRLPENSNILPPLAHENITPTRASVLCTVKSPQEDVIYAFSSKLETVRVWNIPVSLKLHGCAVAMAGEKYLGCLAKNQKEIAIWAAEQKAAEARMVKLSFKADSIWALGDLFIVCNSQSGEYAVVNSVDGKVLQGKQRIPGKSKNGQRCYNSVSGGKFLFVRCGKVFVVGGDEFETVEQNDTALMDSAHGKVVDASGSNLLVLSDNGAAVADIESNCVTEKSFKDFVPVAACFLSSDLVCLLGASKVLVWDLRYNNILLEKQLEEEFSTLTADKNYLYFSSTTGVHSCAFTIDAGYGSLLAAVLAEAINEKFSCEQNMETFVFDEETMLCEKVSMMDLQNDSSVISSSKEFSEQLGAWLEKKEWPTIIKCLQDIPDVKEDDIVKITVEALNAQEVNEDVLHAVVNYECTLPFLRKFMRAFSEQNVHVLLNFLTSKWEQDRTNGNTINWIQCLMDEHWAKFLLGETEQWEKVLDKLVWMCSRELSSCYSFQNVKNVLPETTSLATDVNGNKSRVPCSTEFKAQYGIERVKLF